MQKEQRSTYCYYSIDFEEELLQTNTFIYTISSVKLQFHFEVSEMVSGESHSLVHLEFYFHAYCLPGSVLGDTEPPVLGIRSSEKERGKWWRK